MSKKELSNIELINRVRELLGRYDADMVQCDMGIMGDATIKITISHKDIPFSFEIEKRMDPLSLK